jgi:translation initiation factor 2 subunit 2
MKKKKKTKPLDLGASDGNFSEAPQLEEAMPETLQQEPGGERHVRFQVETDGTPAAAQRSASDTDPDGRPVSADLKHLNHIENSEPWHGTDRDYTYEELLRRIFDMLHGRHPGLGGNPEGRRRLSLRPPQIAREGSKRTVFLNFGEICQSLRRQPEHLAAYMAAELGTTGNLQEGARFVLKGRFQPAGFEGVLRRYIREYVMCASCKSPETVLMRDAHTRLYFMKCENCGSSRSVAPIRQGFMAQTERRSLRRDAT